MYKENGRLNVNISGVVSDINKETETPYIVIDGEKVYINGASGNLFSKIKSGKYINLDCYIKAGKLFATTLK